MPNPKTPDETPKPDSSTQKKADELPVQEKPPEPEKEVKKAEEPKPEGETENKFFVVTASYDEPGRKVVSFPTKELMTSHVLNEAFDNKKG